ncbi:MAG TPA: TetR/AcrR family transcriptional regulator [Actinomycetota bacterium]|nr:TetR/AcrR family transcriptional regulator [Actinomycetota bacterium]
MGGAQKLTKQGKARKQQLMHEAAKLFAHSGYYATRVIDIVKSAGVAKGLFYWYFENKETLFREIVQATRDDLRRAQAKAIEDETDPLKRISKGIEASLRFTAENEHLYVLLRFAGTQDRFASLIDDAQQVHASDTAVHIKEAIANGDITDEDPMLLAQGVVATVFHFARLRSTGAIPNDIDELSKFVSEFCLRGLGVTKSVN